MLSTSVQIILTNTSKYSILENLEPQDLEVTGTHGSKFWRSWLPKSWQKKLKPWKCFSIYLLLLAVFLKRVQAIDH